MNIIQQYIYKQNNNYMFYHLNQEYQLDSYKIQCMQIKKTSIVIYISKLCFHTYIIKKNHAISYTNI